MLRLAFPNENAVFLMAYVNYEESTSISKLGERNRLPSNDTVYLLILF